MVDTKIKLFLGLVLFSFQELSFFLGGAPSSVGG
jgi:hypothetical protein